MVVFVFVGAPSHTMWGGRFEGTISGGRKEERKWKWLWQTFEIEWSVIPSGWLVEWVRNIVATYE